MAQENDGVYDDDAKNTTATGSNSAHGDGTVSDEDVDAIDGKGDDKPIGQDHSLENYEDSEPTSGVGAFQDSSTIRNDVAHIVDDKE